MLASVRRHPVACFVAVTFAVSWGAWLSLAVGGTVVGVGFSPLYLLGLLGPLIGAIVTTALISGTRGLRDLFEHMTRFRVGMRWWGLALGLPLAVAFLVYVSFVAYSMFLLAPIDLPTRRTLGEFTGFPILNAAVLWAVLVVVNGFGEETGWRGWLLPWLQRRWSPLTSSLLVAGIWAMWHVPAFLVNANYRLMPLAMIPMFFAGLVSGAVFLTWLYNRGGRSIALVAVWHGTYNWLSGTVGARGVLAAIESTVVMVIAAVLLVYELRAIWRDRAGRPARHVLTPNV